MCMTFSHTQRNCPVSLLSITVCRTWYHIQYEKVGQPTSWKNCLCLLCQLPHLLSLHQPLRSAFIFSKNLLSKITSDSCRYCLDLLPTFIASDHFLAFWHLSFLLTIFFLLLIIITWPFPPYAYQLNIAVPSLNTVLLSFCWVSSSLLLILSPCLQLPHSLSTRCIATILDYMSPDDVILASKTKQ